jgi:hypothetical protein
MSDGSSPHYIAAMQMRSQDTPAGDLIYSFHEDSNDVQQVATPTILRGAQGTVVAKIGSSPLILATQTSGGRAVDFTTYDFMHPDRFGFMMGVDDLVWRSLVWAARKPFILRGYPRFFASQMDDEVVGWGQRLQDLWNPTYTGTVNSNGIGGPWKITAMAQLVNLQAGGQDRTAAISDVNSGNLKIAFHTNTGISEGDLYWNPQSPAALTDAQWQTNLAFALQVLQGNGGSDKLPPLSKSMVPHFWNLSNNVGYDIWNSLGTRYITEIQQPGAYYGYGPPKPDSMRLFLHPFRVYELPPTGVNPNELYTLYYADFLTVGSTASLPPVKFFAFATQLLGDQFPSFDARWPNDNQAIAVQESVNNFTEYAWRFWSGMAPVQMYNHDGGTRKATGDYTDIIFPEYQGSPAPVHGESRRLYVRTRLLCPCNSTGDTVHTKPELHRQCHGYGWQSDSDEFLRILRGQRGSPAAGSRIQRWFCLYDSQCRALRDRP